MTDTLFSDMQRSDAGPALYAEPHYEYLDRSARLEIARVRSLLEEWFSHYPVEHRAEFLGRFQNGNDIHFIASSFELYLHELFLRSGFTLEVHPQIPSGKKTAPDFKITIPKGMSFYLEAALATDESDVERAAAKRMDAVFDAVDRLNCRNFFLGLDMRGSPKTAPKAKKLRNSLDLWLRTLDPDAIAEQLRRSEQKEAPKFFFKHEGWEITFSAFPRSPEKRGKPGIRPIGTKFFGARWLSTWESIRDAVIRKGRKYGQLELPLIVAVNAGAFHVDMIDIMEALFGQEQFILSVKKPRSKPIMRRAPNGLWHGPKGIRYRRVSGVIIAPDLKPWTFGVRGITLYHNPWSYRPIDPSLLSIPQYIVNEGRMTPKEGTHPREIFGLPEGWPEISQAP
jgi:hypothetical protein